MNKKIFLCVLLALAVGNCAFAKKDGTKPLKGRAAKQAVSPVQEQEMTLGVVQREVKIGSSMDEVATALGSPNIVTKDADGKDTWIYDKMSRVTSYNDSGFAVGLILVGGYGKNKGNYETTQKTLTVVIKFDKNSQVESFTYHMSKF